MSDYNIPVSGGVNGLNVPLHGHIAVYNKEFPVIPNPEGEATGYVTKLGFTPEILQVKDPEVHDWARAEEKPTYTKAEVGLGNVDNTSDLNKPISTATQTALDGKVDKVPGKALSTNDYTDADKAIVDGVTSALATKVDKIAGKGLSSNDYTDYEKTKLAYIQSGAEANVQADWFESNRWSDAFILNKPTKLSDFSNDTGFITSTVDNLTYYYKKSETYTQAEVNALIGSIVTISFLVVQELPQTGEANIIYLVPADEPNPDNIYEEYIYVNNNWEMIGTTKVDLSNYYTKTETDTLLNGKVDKDGDKVLSDNNYSDTDKTKLDGIEAEANKTIVDNSVTSTSTNPVESKAIYNLLNDLLPEATATGNPIAITNASGLNAKSLKVELEPIQDLHGYDSPWVGGGGKNLLKITSSSTTINGITYTVNSDGTVLVNGTATANSAFPLIDNEGEQKLVSMNSTFTLNGCPSGGSSTGYRLQWYLYETGKTATDTGSGATFKPLITSGNLSIVVSNGTTCNNLIFKPMIRLSSISDDTYEPYENICPINGRTQTTVSVNSEDTTIQFGQTVYGGEVDVVSGGTTKTTGLYTFTGNEEWNEQVGYAQYYSKAYLLAGKAKVPENNTKSVPIKTSIGFFNTAYNYLHYQNYTICIATDGRIGITSDLKKGSGTLQGVTLEYELATHTEIDTPAKEISLLKGSNTLVADGDMELIYSKTPQ